MLRVIAHLLLEIELGPSSVRDVTSGHAMLVHAMLVLTFPARNGFGENL
jgi:hypothetical protein